MSNYAHFTDTCQWRINTANSGLGTETPNCVNFAHYRTWSTLSERTAEHPTRNPWANEPQAKRLPRVVKKRLKKESRARFPSSSTQPRAKATLRRKPKPITIPPKRAIKVPSERLFASIAKKYRTHDPVGYEKLKDLRSDPKVLAAEVANSSFVRVLSKYRGYNPHQLMESTIVEFIRVERPKATQPEEEVKITKKRTLTARQLQQVARTAPPPPVAHAPRATSRRRSRKAALSRKYDDSQIVLDALDAVFGDDVVLKAVFCDASLAQAKQLLRSDERIQRLGVELKAVLTSPTRVYTYLDTAIRILIPKYWEEELVAEQKARVEAEARRKEQKAAAQKAAESRELKRRREEKMNSPFDWRELIRA